jgi:hypothetical protein
MGNIDFTVFPKQDDLFGRTPLLWAEAKIGDDDIDYIMFLINQSYKNQDYIKFKFAL